MQSLLESLTSAVGYLFNAPAWLLLLVVLNLLSVFLQWLPWFPNKLIPVVLAVLGIALLELLMDPLTIKNPSPRVVIVLMGVIIAAFAYGLHFALIATWSKFLPKDSPSPKDP